MGMYKDSKGKEWFFKINYGFILYLKDSLQIDLLEPYTNGNNTLSTLLENRYQMLNLLFRAVQYNNKDVPDDEIWASLEGEAIVQLQKAFFEEWANFSQSSGRKDVAAAIRKMQELLNAGIEAAEAEINKIDSTEAIARISQDIKSNTQLTKLSGGSQVG